MTDDENSKMKQDDHDLLIELHTVLKQVRVDIKDLKDNFATRLDVVERRKVWIEDYMTNKTEIATSISDHDKRIDRLEKKFIYYMGAAAIVVVLIGGVWSYFLATTTAKTNCCSVTNINK